jgi:hypothetical protein
MVKEFVYKVQRLTGSIKIDADWSKPAWKNVKPVEIKNHMGSLPAFIPEVKSKMIYDKDNLYLIFNVNDRYVRCITKEINGPVWEDSCIEFFFSPDMDYPGRYFNLEINCGGTPLMHYNLVPRKDFISLFPADINNIEIAHTLPQIVDPEIKEPVNWTVEYRIPLELLRKYSNVTAPGPGIEWRANFYKIAEKNSNPHFLTWTLVQNPVPDFHLPRFFGKIRFK